MEERQSYCFSVPLIRKGAYIVSDVQRNFILLDIIIIISIRLLSFNGHIRHSLMNRILTEVAFL